MFNLHECVDQSLREFIFKLRVEYILMCRGFISNKYYAYVLKPVLIRYYYYNIVFGILFLIKALDVQTY